MLNVKNKNKILNRWTDFLSENPGIHIEEEEKYEIFNEIVKKIYASEEYDIIYLFDFIRDNYIYNDKVETEPSKLKINEDVKLILFKLSKPMDEKIKFNLIKESKENEEIKIVLYYFVLLYSRDKYLNLYNNELLTSLFFYLSGKEIVEYTWYELNNKIYKLLLLSGIKDMPSILSKFLYKNKNIYFKNKKKVYTEAKENNIKTNHKKTSNNYKLKNKIEKINKKIKITKKNILINFNTTNEKSRIKYKVKEYLNFYNNRIIGNPSTGKSYYLYNDFIYKTNIKQDNVFKVSIESGINGTNSNRLILGYGYKKGKAIDKEGIFLKILKKAYANPYDMFSIILEDVHNQDINNLLSPLTAIFKNNDRFKIGKFFDKFIRVKKENWVNNILFDIGTYDSINEIFEKDENGYFIYINDIYLYNKFIFNFIEEYNKRYEDKIEKPVSIILSNIIDDKKEIEIFLPDNLFINMTSNYNENSILPIEWEDRINTVHFEPYKRMNLFKKFINKEDENKEKKQLKLIELFLNINEVLEEQLYAIDFVDIEKVLIGHFLIVSYDKKVYFLDKDINNIIKKMLSSVYNNMLLNNIYDIYQILFQIITANLNNELLEQYINKKSKVYNFKLNENMEIIREDEVSIKKTIKLLLK